jgi:hypothetical protein
MNTSYILQKLLKCKVWIWRGKPQNDYHFAAATMNDGMLNNYLQNPWKPELIAMAEALLQTCTRHTMFYPFGECLYSCYTVWFCIVKE